VCAVLGCEHAPYREIGALFRQAGDLIVPFPILCKDNIMRIEGIIEADRLLASRAYTVSRTSVELFYSAFQRERTALFYGNASNTGYPITEILQGIAYVIAEDDELNGTRIKGSYVDVIERHLRNDTELAVEIRKPDLLTPLIIAGNGRGALIGARNPRVYERLVTTAPDNEYKLFVRPITEEDLINAE
jgi:hypothetical protein